MSSLTWHHFGNHIFSSWLDVSRLVRFEIVRLDSSSFLATKGSDRLGVAGDADAAKRLCLIDYEKDPLS